MYCGWFAKEERYVLLASQDKMLQLARSLGDALQRGPSLLSSIAAFCLTLGLPDLKVETRPRWA